jgi:predicted small integral membrane protein
LLFIIRGDLLKWLAYNLADSFGAVTSTGFPKADVFECNLGGFENPQGHEKAVGESYSNSGANRNKFFDSHRFVFLFLWKTERFSGKWLLWGHRTGFESSLPQVPRRGETMTLRAAKTSLIFGVALYYSFLVLNNLTDYDSNYQFIRHVLMMDSTFSGNHGMWRAMNQPALHTVFYFTIIVWEFVTMILCWWGGLRLAKSLKENTKVFRQASSLAIAGLALSLLMWLVAFLSVGGEWFLMWQSKTWNGQEAAFRMFTVVGIILLLLVQPEAEEQA